MRSEAGKSWTDDLPICHFTGAGFATNQLYRRDGTRQEAYKFRDRSFHCKVDDNIQFYAIFSGGGGANVAEFSLQRMAAEIMLGQLSGQSTEDEIKELLIQAFITVEKEYLNSIDGLLAQKTMLQCEIPDGLNQFEITQKYQHILDQLDKINEELKVETSVVLVLIHNKKMYISNIGNCRALLCKTDAHSVLRIVQLSVDHNLSNEDEILRLCQLGLDDVQALKQAPVNSTRCLGNYLGKAGYKDCEFLSAASAQPIISKPEIIGPVTLDESCRFFILMSGGLCDSLEEICSSDLNKINKLMVQHVVEQFRIQSTLTGVAQSVVHKILDSYMQSIETNANEFNIRSDITLLIRNFNFPLPNSVQKKNSQVRFNPVVREKTTSTICDQDFSYTNTNSSTGSFDNGNETIQMKQSVLPYVSFANYFDNVEQVRKQGKLPTTINFD